MNTDGSMNSAAQQQQFLQSIMQIQQQQTPYYQENAATPPMKVNYQFCINHGHLIFFSPVAKSARTGNKCRGRLQFETFDGK